MTGVVDSAHEVAAVDEGRHEPGPEQLWNESVYLDFSSADGSVGGYVRIGLYPALGVAWWTALVCGPGRPTTAVVAYDAPLPAEGFGPEYDVASPLSTVRVAFSKAGVSYDDPAAVYRGEPGSPATLALDLTLTTDGAPYSYVGTTRYEVPVTVAGWIEVDGERIALSCAGQRDHSWGVRDWWDFGWCWNAVRLDDGTRVHTTHVRLPGFDLPFGYLQPPVGPVESVSELTVTEELGAEGLPTSARIVAQGLGLDVVPLAFAPVLLVSPDGRESRFPRAMARFTADDGRTGLGWIEWNQVQPALP